MTQFFSRTKKSINAGQGVADYNVGHTSYSGPSLMLASSQIRSGLLDSSTLTNSEFFCDVARDPEMKDNKKEQSSKRALDGLYPDDRDNQAMLTIKPNSKERESLVVVTLTNSSPRRSKKIENSEEFANNETKQNTGLLKPKCRTLQDPSLINDDGCKSERMLFPKRIQNGLSNLKTALNLQNKLPCCWKCGPSCACDNRTRMVLVALVLFFLVILSVIILSLALTLNRTEQDIEPIEDLPPPLAYASPLPKESLVIPMQRRICFNASCLRVASVITERLQYFNSPDGFARIRGVCSNTDLFRLINVLAFGDKTEYPAGQNNVEMMQKRLLHSIWSSVSETLQNVGSGRYVPMWIQKLSFIYRRLLSRGVVNRQEEEEEQRKIIPEKILDDEVVSSSNGQYTLGQLNNTAVSMNTMPSTGDDHLTLEVLLQRGNIAFHGLDNVLISVQLELRVPLFFNTWVTKAHNPGMLEMRIPVLDSVRQPDWFPSDELAGESGQSSHQRWREIQTYVEHLQKLARKRMKQSLPASQLSSANTSEWPAALSVLYKLKSLSHRGSQPRLEQSRLTMRELMRRTQQSINIPRYLGALLSNNRSTLLPRDMAVLVNDVEYFENLGTFLSQTSYSDLQEYVTFSILHKYAAYVDDEAAMLKKKLFKPLAERLGMRHVDSWPLILDLASPGLRLIVLQQWTLRHLERSFNVINSFLFQPLQAEFKQLAGILVNDSKTRDELLDKLENMKLRFIEQNFKNRIEEFYDSLQVTPGHGVLSQAVEFHHFMSMKALPPDYSHLFGDCGLSSQSYEVSHYLHEQNIIELSILLLQWPYFAADLSVPNYINFGPVWYSLARSIVNTFPLNGAVHGMTEMDNLRQLLTHDNQVEDARDVLLQYNIDVNALSRDDSVFLTQMTLTMEAVGRSYQALDVDHQMSNEPRLPGVDLSNGVTFYLWLFQSVCERTNDRSQRPHPSATDLNECTAAQVAAHMSPTFRQLMSCSGFETAHEFKTNDIKNSYNGITFGQKSFYPSRMIRPMNQTTVKSSAGFVVSQR